MKENQQNMSLEAYLDKKKIAYKEEIEDLCKALGGMPYETFRYKVRNNTFDNLQKEKLSEKTGIPVEKLFPISKN